MDQYLLHSDQMELVQQEGLVLKYQVNIVTLFRNYIKYKLFVLIISTLEHFILSR